MLTSTKERIVIFQLRVQRRTVVSKLGAKVQEMVVRTWTTAVRTRQSHGQRKAGEKASEVDLPGYGYKYRGQCQSHCQ